MNCSESLFIFVSLVILRVISYLRKTEPVQPFEPHTI